MSGDAAGFSGGDFEGDLVGDRGDGLAAAPASSAVEAMANDKHRAIKGILTRTPRAYRRGFHESRSNLSGLEVKMLWNKPQSFKHSEWEQAWRGFNLIRHGYVLRTYEVHSSRIERMSSLS